MNFYINGKYFTISRITGPTHNFLGLSFSTDKVQVEINQIKLNENDQQILSSSEVAKKVLEGVDKANNVLKTNYRVSEIQFVINDTPPTDVYKNLAEQIVLRMHKHINNVLNYDGSA